MTHPDPGSDSGSAPDEIARLVAGYSPDDFNAFVSTFLNVTDIHRKHDLTSAIERHIMRTRWDDLLRVCRQALATAPHDLPPIASITFETSDGENGRFFDPASATMTLDPDAPVRVEVFHQVRAALNARRATLDEILTDLAKVVPMRATSTAVVDLKGGSVRV